MPDQPEASRRAAQTFVHDEQRPSPPASPRLAMRPLMADDIWLDYPCCVRNAQHIRETRGGDWPGESLTWHEDLIDLAFHQREFELGRSFAYILTSLDGGEMFGCLYIYPPGHPFNDAEPADLADECDAVVNYWVTEPCFEAGLHHHVYELVARWMSAWPFRSPRVVPNAARAGER